VGVILKDDCGAAQRDDALQQAVVRHVNSDLGFEVKHNARGLFALYQLFFTFS
jgi:hypothetical protein